MEEGGFQGGEEEGGGEEESGEGTEEEEETTFVHQSTKQIRNLRVQQRHVLADG